jgi:hypothetical protein
LSVLAPWSIFDLVVDDVAPKPLMFGATWILLLLLLLFIFLILASIFKLEEIKKKWKKLKKKGKRKRNINKVIPFLLLLHPIAKFPKVNPFDCKPQSLPSSLHRHPSYQSLYLHLFQSNKKNLIFKFPKV